MDLFKARRRENRNMTARHFPAPCIVEELDACFVVIDSAGQKSGSSSEALF